MKKVLLTMLMLLLTIISYAEIIYIDENILPKHIPANKNDISEYMCYGDCEHYIGRYVYFVNSTKTSKSNFFVQKFKSENYKVYKDQSKLGKYRLFNYYSFEDFANKVYKVIDARYIKPKNYYGYRDNYVELTLMDVANNKNVFKYLNIGEFRECPNCPLVDIAFYKYHQAKLNKDARYKIRSSIIKGTYSNHKIWWKLKDVAYDDIENSFVYVFESDDNRQGYILAKDVEHSFDSETVFASSIIDESKWENYCLEKGEKYAHCKLERKVIEGMSRADALNIMGKPTGVLYNSRNIHDGWAIVAYNNQWIEFTDDQVSCVDLYKKLWDKGDVYMIDIISHKLYNY